MRTPVLTVLPGEPNPLGSTWTGQGVNFAVYSENATSVELCVYDADDGETRLPLTQRTAFVWHGFVPGLEPGTRYAFRADGPYDPGRGLRFNPNVALLDPYAKSLDGVERWDRGCFGYELLSGDDLRREESDQRGAPRGVVVDPSFDWEDDRPPGIPLHRSVIYEAHVRGLTKLHPEVPEELRGTYAGIGHPAVTKYLSDLGVTAIELMPIHGFVDDKVLQDRGLQNYWGYNSIAFFAPDVRYRGTGPGRDVAEVKEMVKALHRAGIEVILDVVYNHTAEGNHLGPTLSFKGLDNTTYYRLADDPRHYFDCTGTGNTLNVRHPQVLQLIMDSLRYWVQEIHVDGFRFDLAAALARQLHEVDRLSSFFTLIHQSPTLSSVKLIAEPWDLGQGGYQVGSFPVRWAEWNGRFRDAMRSMWRGDPQRLGEIGYRLTGSSDLYELSGRKPSASVNFVTAHDGFTLNDLVSYDRKHNEANGEDNRDGNDDERSWSCGAEGPTLDPDVVALRRRQRRNLLATLLLSQGTPMLLAGDELQRTQHGNNNAYCQNNETSWVHWDVDREAMELRELVRKLTAIRARHPALHRASFFRGRAIHGTDLADLLWFRADGERTSDEDWERVQPIVLGMFLAGRGIHDVDEQGRPLIDDNLLLLTNAQDQDVAFALPGSSVAAGPWTLLVDTSDDAASEVRAPGEKTTLVSRSLKLFSCPAQVVRERGAVHVLGATYRLQLGPKLGFAGARALVPYLRDLGVTDLYVSPIFRAVPGSAHGYDVVDHTTLSPELGGEEGFDALAAALREAGMGLVVDWVPNHVGIASPHNPLWDDVLENGPSSRYAEFFDIDWKPPKEALKGKVLLPFLEDQYGRVLERGDLGLVWEEGLLRVRYFDRRLPLDPRTLDGLLRAVAKDAGLPPESPSIEELESIVFSLAHLPARGETAAEARGERAREKAVVRRRLSALVAGDPAIADAIGRVLATLNGARGDAPAFDALDRLLDAQAYRLASWRVATEEINYRRFFDVNELAALRMEAPEVFEHAHAKLFSLLEAKKIQALRLDHTDGLYDPGAYFFALQRRFVAPPDPQALASPEDLARPLPLLAEKIVQPGEGVPPSWPIDGTTGYEAAAALRGLFVDARAVVGFSALYRELARDALEFADHAYESKLCVLRYGLASEVSMLARQFERIATRDRRRRDFTLMSLTEALVETVAAFDVYRTYVRAGERAGEDERHIRAAVASATDRSPSLSQSIFAFLQELLLLNGNGRAVPEDEDGRARTRFALRFQQLTSTVMAKAIEDTAFYRYTRLVSLNDVGGDPSRFGLSVADFHAHNRERMRTWPLGMTTVSTHDSKRGEDAAARISALTEIPDEVERAFRELWKLAEPARSRVAERAAPSPTLEYGLYQAILGAWPFGWDGRDGREAFLQRVRAYAQKAAREAKHETSWTNPREDYESAVDRYVTHVLSPGAFVERMRDLSHHVDVLAATNALAMTLLRLAAPGVPDTYQGAELWNQALVDPDNRGEVDWDARVRGLAWIKDRLGDRRALCRELLASFADGRAKQYVVFCTLQLRRSNALLFRRGRYEAIDAGEQVVAFARTFNAESVVVAVPRLIRGRQTDPARFVLGGDWSDVTLSVPPGSYDNVLTGARETGPLLRAASLFADFPVALLVRVEGAANPGESA